MHKPLPLAIPIGFAVMLTVLMVAVAAALW